MSTKVLESEKGCASWMSWRMSPWQYMGESQGAITEPLVYRALMMVGRAANVAIMRDCSEAIFAVSLEES